MENRTFRTYKRRSVTRRSGYKASGIRTGGECLIINSEYLIIEEENAVLRFESGEITLESLFEMDLGIIAFGGYIKPSNQISLKLKFSYNYADGTIVNEEKDYGSEIKSGTWNGIGMHINQQIDSAIEPIINNATVSIEIHAKKGTILNFASVDFDAISYDDYLVNPFYKPFNQKTSMHIPHIYYLSSEKNLDEYLVEVGGVNKQIFEGEPIVLKGCNRCTRYLPINILEEQDTLAFSLHCKKNSPCTHPLFSYYKIDSYKNLKEISSIETIENNIIKDRLKSYYGHQLECRACKKFYVNNALNHLRKPQQYKEDGLRRRSLEVLVNTLLQKDLVHHEYEKRTKRQFTEYIWKKFNGRCFKCSKKLKINEMHLDHTMPLAFLYRLDETATCLCAEHNSQKRDSFPAKYYTEEERVRLAEITGISISLLSEEKPNMTVVMKLVENVVWFFDDFLMTPNYQKVRDEILTADKIYASLVRILKETDVNLIETYYSKTGRYPKSITSK